MSDKLTVFATGNGDTILIEAAGKSILTDINYVENPHALLRQAYSMLKPGGRLVLSSLRPDADTSRICVDGVAELRSGLGRAALGAAGERRLGESLRGFINDAARLLDLEEQGIFRFWAEAELLDIVKRAGFEGVSAMPAFGEPPQAFIVSANRAR